MIDLINLKKRLNDCVYAVLTSMMMSTLCYGNVELTDALSYQALKQDLIKNNITDTAGMLSFFAKKPAYSQLLNSPILEKYSGAIHSEQVSAQFPRIVMGSGNLTLHFTSNPNLPGQNLVEVIEFEPVTGQLLFHLINFALAGTSEMFFDNPTRSNQDVEGLKKLLKKYESTTGGSVTACDGCHFSGLSNFPRRDMQQNWNPQFELFHVFGYNGGVIKKDTPEYNEFITFLQSKDDSVNGKLFSHLNLKIAANSQGDYLLGDDPVKVFTDHIFSIARKQMNADFHRLSKYSSYQYQIAGALSNCEDLQGFLTPESRTVHERMLLEISHLQYSMLYLTMGNIQSQDVRPEFWQQFDKKEDPSLRLKEALFLDYTTLPLIDALAKEIQASIAVQGEINRRFLPEGKTSEFDKAQAEQMSRKYIGRLAKLKYIFRGYFPQVKAVAYSLVNNLTSFSNKTFEDLFAEGSTYHSEGADVQLDRFLEDDFGPQFLQENPSLDLFTEHKFKLGQLTVPLENYCSLLQKSSLKQFELNPLNPIAGTGKNGDLCSLDAEICQYPFYCTDRGDGILACSGADRTSGNSGILCAAPAENPDFSNYFCKSGLSCKRDPEKIFKCLPM